MSSDNILVGVRVRPLLTREVNEGTKPFWKTSGDHIVQIDPDSQKEIATFTYDRIFDEKISNENLYEEVAEPLVQSAFEGFNGTIFAYGQTASGKTFTMSGTDTYPGIIPLSIQKIFQYIEECPKREFLLRASYMEIYQENILDLITGNKISTLREDPAGNVYLPDLKETCVGDEKSLMKLMASGDKKRKVAETNMNERSSRSHSIFRLILESRERGNADSEAAVAVAHLNMVDLAGSENASQTGATGERLKEGGSINRSLFMLGRVISQLSDGESFINFRDSKLTRILQNSLGGNARTAIICTVTVANREQTLSTLRFASRAKSVKNKPVVNEVVSDAALLKRYANEIKKLKFELDSALNTDTALEVQEVKGMLDEQQKHNQDLQLKIKNLSEMIMVSSISNGEKTKVKNKPHRRATLATSNIREHRLSMIPTADRQFMIHKENFEFVQPPPKQEPLKSSLKKVSFETTYDFDTTGSRDSVKNQHLSTVSEEGSMDIDDLLSNASENSNTLQDSFRSVDFRSPSAFQFDSSMASLDESFVAPFSVTTRRSRRKKKVEILPACTCDASSQTEEVLLSPKHNLVQVTPEREAPSFSPASPCTIPTKCSSSLKIYETPKHVLRARYKDLRSKLDKKDAWLENYQDEIVHLTEFQKKEIEMLDESFRDKIDHSNLEKVEEMRLKIKSLEKSLNDSEELYIEANKNLSFQNEEIKFLTEENLLLKDKCKKFEEVGKAYDEMKIKKASVDQELLEFRERCKRLENERMDFDVMMELSHAKHHKLENELKESLQKAWSDTSESQGGNYRHIEDRNWKRSTDEVNTQIKELNDELELARQRIMDVEVLNEDLNIELSLLKSSSNESMFKKPLLPLLNMDDTQDFDQSEPTHQMIPTESNPLKIPKTPTSCLNQAKMSLFPRTPISNLNHSSISIKLSETIHALEESILATSPEDVGCLDSVELVEIKHKLLLLQDYFVQTAEREYVSEEEQIIYSIHSEYLQEFLVLELFDSVCGAHLMNIAAINMRKKYIKNDDSNISINNYSECEYGEQIQTELKNPLNLELNSSNIYPINASMDCTGMFKYEYQGIDTIPGEGLSLADELKMASHNVTSEINLALPKVEVKTVDSRDDELEYTLNEEKNLKEINILHDRIRYLEERIEELIIDNSSKDKSVSRTICHSEKNEYFSEGELCSIKNNSFSVEASSDFLESDIGKQYEMKFIELTGEINLLKEQLEILKEENADLMNRLNRISSNNSLDTSFHSVAENEDDFKSVNESVGAILDNHQFAKISVKSIVNVCESGDYASGVGDSSSLAKINEYKNKIDSLNETIKCQDEVIVSLERRISDLDNLRIKEEDLESLITDLVYKEEKLEEWEATLANRETNFMDREKGKNKEQVLKTDEENVITVITQPSRFTSLKEISGGDERESSFCEIKKALLNREGKALEIIQANEQEICMLKMELEDKCTKIKELEYRVELLGESKIKIDIDSNSMTYMQENVPCEKNSCLSLLKEREDLSVKMTSLKEINIGLECQISEFLIKLEQFSLVRKKNGELHEHIVELTSEMSLKQIKIESLVEEMRESKDKIHFNEENMTRLEATYELVKRSNEKFIIDISNRDEELIAFRSNIEDLSCSLCDAKQSLESQTTKNCRLQAEIEELQVQFDKLKVIHETQKEECSMALEKACDRENLENSDELIQLKEIQSAIRSSGINDVSQILNFFSEFSSLKEKICEKEIKVKELLLQAENLDFEHEKNEHIYRNTIIEHEQSIKNLKSQSKEYNEIRNRLEQEILDKDIVIHEQKTAIINLQNAFDSRKCELNDKQEVETFDVLSESMYSCKEELAAKEKEFIESRQKLVLLEGILESRNLDICKRRKETDEEVSRLISLLEGKDEELFETKAKLELTMQELQIVRAKIQGLQKNYDTPNKAVQDKEGESSFKFERDNVIASNEQGCNENKITLQKDIKGLHSKYVDAAIKKINNVENLIDKSEFEECMTNYNLLKDEYQMLHKELLANHEQLKTIETDVYKKDEQIKSMETYILQISALLKDIESEHGKCIIKRLNPNAEVTKYIHVSDADIGFSGNSPHISNVDDEKLHLEIKEANDKYVKLLLEKDKHCKDFDEFKSLHLNCTFKNEVEKYRMKMEEANEQLEKLLLEKDEHFEDFRTLHLECISKDEVEKYHIEIEEANVRLGNLSEIDDVNENFRISHSDCISKDEAEKYQMEMEEANVMLVKSASEKDKVYENFRISHSNCISMTEEKKYQLEIEEANVELEKLQVENIKLNGNFEDFRIEHSLCISKIEMEKYQLQMEEANGRLEKLILEKDKHFENFRILHLHCISQKEAEKYRLEMEETDNKLEKLSSKNEKLFKDFETFNDLHSNCISDDVRKKYQLEIDEGIIKLEKLHFEKEKILEDFDSYKRRTEKDFEEKQKIMKNEFISRIEQANSRFKILTSESEKSFLSFNTFRAQHEDCISQQELTDNQNHLRLGCNIELEETKSKHNRLISEIESFKSEHKECISNDEFCNQVQRLMEERQLDEMKIKAQLDEKVSDFEEFKNLHKHCICLEELNEKQKIMKDSFERKLREAEFQIGDLVSNNEKHSSDLTAKESLFIKLKFDNNELKEMLDELKSKNIENEKLVIGYKLFKEEHQNCTQLKLDIDSSENKMENISNQCKKISLENKSLIDELALMKSKHENCSAILASKESTCRKLALNESEMTDRDVLYQKVINENEILVQEIELLKSQCETFISIKDAEELRAHVVEKDQEFVEKWDLYNETVDKNKALLNDLEMLRTEHEGCIVQQISNGEENSKMVCMIEKYEVDLCMKENSYQKVLMESEDLKKDLSNLESINMNLRKNISNLESIKSEHAECVSIREKSILEIEKLLSVIRKYEDEIGEIRQDLSTINEERKRLENELMAKDLELKWVMEKCNSFDEVDKFRFEKDALNKKLDMCNKVLLQKDDSLNNANARIKDLISDIENVKSAMGVCQLGKYSLQKELKDKQAKLHSLETLIIVHESCKDEKEKLKIEIVQSNEKFVAISREHESLIKEFDERMEYYREFESDMDRDFREMKDKIANLELKKKSEFFCKDERNELLSEVEKLKGKLEDLTKEHQRLIEESDERMKHYCKFEADMDEDFDHLNVKGKKQEIKNSQLLSESIPVSSSSLISKESISCAGNDTVLTMSAKSQSSSVIASENLIDGRIPIIINENEYLKENLRKCECLLSEKTQSVSLAKDQISDLLSNNKHSCNNEVECYKNMTLLNEQLETIQSEHQSLIKEFDQQINYYKEMENDYDKDMQKMKGSIKTLEFEKSLLLDTTQNSLPRTSLKDRNSTMNEKVLLIINENETIKEKLRKCEHLLKEKTWFLSVANNKISQLSMETSSLNNEKKIANENIEKEKLNSCNLSSNEKIDNNQKDDEGRILRQKLETLQSNHKGIIKVHEKRVEYCEEMEDDYAKDVVQVNGNIESLKVEKCALLSERAQLLLSETKMTDEPITAEHEIKNLNSELCLTKERSSELQIEHEMLKLAYTKKEFNLNESKSKLIQANVASDDVIQALNKKIHNMEEQNKKLVQLQQKEKQNLEFDSPNNQKALQEKNFSLLRDNNILKMKIDAVDTPAVKELKIVKNELDIMHTKNQKLVQEVRRLQDEHNSDMSLCEVVTKKSHTFKKEVDEQHNLQYGSGIIMEVQMMGLERLNYELEKDKKSLKEKEKVLNGHVEHYREIAQKWKNKAKEEENIRRKLEEKNERITTAAEDLKKKYIQRKEEMEKMRIELGATLKYPNKDLVREFPLSEISSDVSLPLSANTVSPRKNKASEGTSSTILPASTHAFSSRKDGRKEFTDKYPHPIEAKEKPENSIYNPTACHNLPRRSQHRDDTCKTQ